MEQVIESKLLDFNLKKSKFMVVGKKSMTKELEEELAGQRIELCGKEMKRSDSEKWLGDYIHCLGNDESIITTIKKRYGLAVSTIMDIRNIVEDSRASITGGMMTGIEIYEMCVIPFLLNNSEVWDHIPKEALELLDILQFIFYTQLCGLSRRGTPQKGLLWEVGGVTMNHRIIMRKLNFYHHLKNQNKNSLAHIFMSIQSELKYPGLIVECEELLIKFGLGEKSPTSFSKEAWKRMTRRKILNENRSYILQEMKRYKKMDYLELKEEPFGTKPYFKKMNVKDARL